MAKEVRTTDFLMALAYATDLATGQSQDFAIRSCVLAMRIAEAARFGETGARRVFHLALLRYIGCNADTHLMSALLGDEIAFRRDFARIDIADRAAIAEVVMRSVRRTLAGAPAEDVARAIERALGEGLAASVPILAGHCEVAERIGARMGLDRDTCATLGQLYERWDGHGLPNGLKGEAVDPAVRVVGLAQDAIVLAEAHGPEAMAALIAKRRGGAYDPDLADLFLGRADRLMRGIDASVDRATILSLEPAPNGFLDAATLDEAYLVLADMADMRMPFTLGHSRAVADLAEAAGRVVGLPAEDVRGLRRAGLAHDIGELSVPVATWMRAGPLSVVERDAARLHPYHAERILTGFDGSVAALVSRHHERLDGTGYHRGIRGAELSPAARILAAAECFQTAREARPHRTALSGAAAAERLRSAARIGALDRDATEAVLSVAGHGSRRTDPGERLGGLTAREIDVLRQLVAGKTVKETAIALGIAAKTADNHTQSLYSKLGVKTRAAAVLHALERGLIQPNGEA